MTTNYATRSSGKGWVTQIVLLFVLYYAINWLWHISLLTARLPRPGKSLSLVCLVVMTLAAIWILISIWLLLRRFGKKGIIILLVVWYAFSVGKKLLTIPIDQPISSVLSQQMVNAAIEGVTAIPQAIIGFPKAVSNFRFAYTGHRVLVDLPGVNEPSEPLTGRIIEPNYITSLETTTSISTAEIRQDEATPLTKLADSAPVADLLSTAPPPTSSASTSNQVCEIPMNKDGAFYDLWMRHQNKLGCPKQERELGADGINFVEQPFENGHMFLFSSEPIHFVIVKYGTPNPGEIGSGTWQLFDKDDGEGIGEMWPEDKEENFCFEGQGLPYDIYNNFNRVWCKDQEIRSRLGQPRNYDSRKLLKLYGANNSQYLLAQGFENGFVLRDSDGASQKLAYIFFDRDGTYLRERY